MAFVDEVTIRVQAGAGGDGCVSFRREKYIPFGGPNGGNGGKGGDVVLVPSRNKQSLLDFKYQPFFRATRGEHGKGKDMDGRGGEDLVIEVPIGTIVYEAETGHLLADLTDEGKPFLIAAGGAGGRGNKTFVSSTQRAPRFATPGKNGESLELRMELRLLADIGLVGLPNAGKSSFLRRVSRAQPKVADYPFTTLDPNLGVVKHKDCSLVFADLPGLIEGAHEGAGLGHKFLKHVSRNRMLLHLVDASQDADRIKRNVEIVNTEISSHDPELGQRPQMLLFTKADLLSEADRTMKMRALEGRGLNGYFVSSHSGEGVNSLLDTLAGLSARWQQPEAPLL